MNQIKCGAMLSYISIAINVVAGLIFTPWMIAQIGTSNYGLYTLSNSLISLFLFDFGLSAAAVRYISKYKAEGNLAQIDNFLGTIYKLYILIDFILAIIFSVILLYLDKIYIKLTPEELKIFKTIYIISALFSIMNFPFVTLNGILTAFEKFIALKSADIIYRVIFVTVTFIALSKGQGIYALVLINTGSALFITIYKYYVVHKTTPVRANFKYRDPHLSKAIFSFSLWITISSLAQRLIMNITPSILGIVSNSEAIAVFGIVATIEGYAYIITSAINGLFMPKVSRICIEEDNENKLNQLTIQVGNFQFIINSLLVLGFILLGKDFIILWVGPQYIEAYYGLSLILFSGLFYNSLEIANTVMVVKNKVNIQAYITLVTGMINIILSPILAKRFGVIGACLSIFIAYMIRAIISHIAYHKVINIDIPRFIKECYIRYVPAFVITLVIGYSINKAIPMIGFAAFILKGLIIVGSYLVLNFITYKIRRTDI